MILNYRNTINMANDHLLSEHVVSWQDRYGHAPQPLYLQGLTVICSQTLFLILRPFGPIHVSRS
jgi:hypothetical protein